MSAVWWCVGWAVVPVVLLWQMRRVRRDPLDRDRIVAEARAHTEPPAGPAPDTEWGSDLALHDACELAYSVPWPALDDAGVERLLTAIHDHREEEPS